MFLSSYFLIKENEGVEKILVQKRCQPLSFIHTADIHLGAFSHSSLRKASVDALKDIIDLSLTENIKTIVIAGDLFETPRVGHELTLETVKIIKKAINNNIKIIVTPGSHDLTVKGHGILALLNEVGLINMTKFSEFEHSLKLEPIIIDNLRFYGIPGLRGNKEIEYLEKRRITYENYDENYVNILIAHTSLYLGSIDLSKISPKYSVIKLSKDAQKSIHGKFKYLALGHIHFPVPLETFFEGNVAYPGSPIGRDANDIFETYKLRKMFNTDRRVLVVNADSTPPKIKAITHDFDIDVDVVEIDNVSKATSLARSKFKDMSRKYRCLIVYTGKIDFEKYNRIRKDIEEEARKFSAWVHIIHSEASEDYYQLIEGFKMDLSNIESLETEAVANAIRKFGLKIDSQKLLMLINVLGKDYPEGVKKGEFDEEVVEEALKILEEILGGK